MLSGMIFDIARFSVHDGPGIRTTVFFKGCQMSCRWCHNPESISSEPQFSFQSELCRGCKECVKACPGGFLREPSFLERSVKCNSCTACIDACNSGARKLIGHRMNVDEVMQEIKKDYVFYAESGGGVTFSGGEPALQPDFLLALLDACHNLGIHTAVDTNGCADPDIMKRIADRTDLILFDIKHMDDAEHRKYTGVSNAFILKNIKALSADGARIIARFPLVPGVNDDDENIHRTAEFLRSLGKITGINILPYHRIGSDKYGRIGRCYTLPETEEIPRERLKNITEIFKNAGINAKIGG